MLLQGGVGLIYLHETALFSNVAPSFERDSPFLLHILFFVTGIFFLVIFQHAFLFGTCSNFLFIWPLPPLDIRTGLLIRLSPHQQLFYYIIFSLLLGFFSCYFSACISFWDLFKFLVYLASASPRHSHRTSYSAQPHQQLHRHQR